MAPVEFQCDACLHAVGGYKKKELEDDHGWEWKPLKGGAFVLCGECVHEYAKRRALKDGA